MSSSDRKAIKTNTANVSKERKSAKMRSERAGSEISLESLGKVAGGLGVSVGRRGLSISGGGRKLSIGHGRVSLQTRSGNRFSASGNRIGLAGGQSAHRPRNHAGAAAFNSHRPHKAVGSTKASRTSASHASPGSRSGRSS